MVTVGTRWHPRDVFAHIASTGLYKVFTHPAIDADGNSYWPEQYSLERLEDKRLELGSTDFELMYLANPLAAQGKLLKAEWLQGFPQGDIKSTWPSFYGMDPAFKKLQVVETRARKRSRCAIDHFKIAPFGIVLVDVWAGYWTEAEAEEQLIAHAAIDQPKRILIESNGVGDPFYQSVLRRTRLPLVPVNTTQDTVARVNQMAPDFEFGRARVSDAITPGLNLFRDEWVSLPDGTDDTLSAGYYGWKAAAHGLWRDDPGGGDGPAKPAKMNPFKVIEKAYA